MKNDAKGNLWKSVFPILSIILWLAAIFIPMIAQTRSYTDSYFANMAITKAYSWRAACCIGAIISTTASYVIIQIAKHIEK